MNSTGQQKLPTGSQEQGVQVRQQARVGVTRQAGEQGRFHSKLAKNVGERPA